MKSHTFAGIEIGGTKLQIVLGNRKGQISQRWRYAVDRSQGGAGIRHQIQSCLQPLKGKFRAIGVGFGGPVDYETGKIARSHHIEGWTGFSLGTWLKKLTGRPVSIDNDANVACLAEAHFGAGRGFNPVFYVTLGSGTGGGLVVNGQIYHGVKPGESEFGHLRLDRSGTIVEERCSGWAVDTKIRAYCKQHPRSLLSKLTRACKTGESKHLKTALAQNDPAAKRILKETAEDLSMGLSHVTQLFHPQTVVLGGGLSLLGEPLRKAVAKALSTKIMGVFLPGPKVQIAKLSEDVVPVGALFLASRILR